MYHVGYTEELSVSLAIAVTFLSEEDLLSEALDIVKKNVLTEFYKVNEINLSQQGNLNDKGEKACVLSLSSWLEQVSSNAQVSLSEQINEAQNCYKLQLLSNCNLVPPPAQIEYQQELLSGLSVQLCQGFSLYYYHRGYSMNDKNEQSKVHNDMELLDKSQSSEMAHAEIFTSVNSIKECSSGDIPESIIAVRGHLLRLPFHPFLVELVEKFNTNQVLVIDELISPLLALWEEEVALYLIQLLIEHRGVELVTKKALSKL
jgi:hypothetical protein